MTPPVQRTIFAPFNRTILASFYPSIGGCFLALACGVGLPCARLGGREAALARRYRPGQRSVYQMEMHTQATVETQPPGLEAFLPALPTDVSTRQQNTVIVRAVHADGSADVEHRFDRFELQSNLAERSPKELRGSAQQAEQDFSRRLSGQTVTAHYDREGRLLKFEGADAMLAPMGSLVRGPVEAVLRFFLEQTGGNAFYPEHPPKPDEEWSRRFSSQPTEAEPWTIEGEGTWHYSGQGEYQGSRAAIIDFRFTDVLTPALGNLRQAVVPVQQRGFPKGLAIQVRGHGQSRMLVALDDGRVLQNHATISQALTATLTSLTGASLEASDPAVVNITSQTTLTLDESQGQQYGKHGTRRSGQR